MRKKGHRLFVALFFCPSSLLSSLLLSFLSHLVQQQDLGRLQEGPRDHDALPLPSGERSRGRRGRRRRGLLFFVLASSSSLFLFGSRQRDRADPGLEPLRQVLDEAQGVGRHGGGADVVERGVGHAVGDL